MNFKLILSAIVTCLYCHFALSADPSPQLFPAKDAEAYVANCVNVITGNYCESKIDLKVHAQGEDSEGLLLKRVFNTTSMHASKQVGGWSILPQLFAVLRNDKANSIHSYEVVLEDGTKRIYKKIESMPTQILGLGQTAMLASQENEAKYFHLIKEILPSREQIDYTYDGEGNLSLIELKNVFESQVLAWMHFSYQDHNNGYRLKVATSDDKHLEYVHTLQKLLDGASIYALTYIEGNDEGSCQFSYQIIGQDCRLVKKEFQDGRKEDIYYDDLGRVKMISLSNQLASHLSEHYHFHYDQGFTDVIDASGQINRYEANGECFLSKTRMDNKEKASAFHFFEDNAAGNVIEKQAYINDQAQIKTLAYLTTGLNAQEENLLALTDNILASQSNIAPIGTAYGWSRMTSSTANTGRVVQPGLNNNNLTNDIDIQPNGEKVGAWEAAGIIWSSAASITAVDFINGSVTKYGDGFLTANCKLQFSTDGSTWSNSNWTISPSYPYSASAGGKTYMFSGPAVSGIRGARVVGQVRTKDTSYHWLVKEIRVTGSIGNITSFTIAASTGANGSISPSGIASVKQGGSQLFTITPAAGYAINNVIVDGASQGSINSYTFSNVQANHLISATFKTTTTCSIPPATPTGLTSSSQTNSSINLSWNPVGASTGCSVTYNVYNGGTLAATVSTANAVIQGLSPNTTYTFTVAAKNSAGISAQSSALSVKTLSSGNYTPQQILAAIQSHMTPSVQVNSLPHINTMTRKKDVNVYEVSSGVFAYTSSMAIDTDGSDPDPDPDHQSQTTWQDSKGAHLGSHRVPFYVLGDDCWDKTSPCPHFFYGDHNIKGLQFALMFYNGKVIGAVFGDTQTANSQTTSDNDSRELGEASVAAANMLGIPSSGTTGGVNNGVTVVIFSGSQWVVQGTNQGTGPVGSSTGSLSGNAQALIQKALNTLGTSFGL
jgi:hypothetical protein